MGMETSVVTAIVAGASAYALWRIFRVLRPGGSPCEGCEMKKNCKKFGGLKEK